MDERAPGYVGRFAPSPTGPLHRGSLVAAMASFLDARAHSGRWLLRIEDVDRARAVPGAAEHILATLAALGMAWDGDVTRQSERDAVYQAALARLGPHAYPCGCSRREIADSRLGIAADGAAIYPGTCRAGLRGKPARAIRLRVPDADDPAATVAFVDRWQGPVAQNLATETGDFVLRRADGFWAYQLAVVADDADQGVTHVVRGADLLDSTARQIWLQRLLGAPTPAWLHVPAVRNAAGEKLSKQTGATAVDAGCAAEELAWAARFLGLETGWNGSLDAFWRNATAAWARRLATLPEPRL
ncbi:MAG: tRNA glutamyl-Q(34) synthetase GluQRS [Burkholderiaceae bacterium]